ncbi:MAG: 50S ribosomal protein L6, partial [Rhodospirillaceae bacterium]
MSRVGKYPIAVPDGVNVAVSGNTVTVKGKLGEMIYSTPEEVATELADGKVTVTPKKETKKARALWGTTRANINNMVVGVSKGFSKTLEINGVGFKAQAQGKKLNLSLGFSHDVIYDVPEGIEVKTPQPTQVDISGANRQRVGQVAAEIRAFRPPEPYK